MRNLLYTAAAVAFLTSDSRLKPFSALAFTSLVIASLGAGCSDVKNLQDAACCDGFKVGTVMTAADFNATINASAQTTFAAFANAASDLSATATGAIADVTTACQNIALDLGADPADCRPALRQREGADQVQVQAAYPGLAGQGARRRRG